MKFKWILIAIFVVWGGFAVYFASKLGPLTKEEQYLADDHKINVI